MLSLRLTSVNHMTSLNFTLYYHNTADVCNRSDCIIKILHSSEMKGVQGKESIMGVRGR